MFCKLTNYLAVKRNQKLLNLQVSHFKSVKLLDSAINPTVQYWLPQ